MEAGNKAGLDIYHWLWHVETGYQVWVVNVSLGPRTSYTTTSASGSRVTQNILNRYEAVIKALDSLGLIERHLPTHIQKWETCENWLTGAGVVCKPWTI